MSGTPARNRLNPGVLWWISVTQGYEIRVQLKTITRIKIIRKILSCRSIEEREIERILSIMAKSWKQVKYRSRFIYIFTLLITIQLSIYIYIYIYYLLTYCTYLQYYILHYIYTYIYIYIYTYIYIYIYIYIWYIYIHIYIHIHIYIYIYI